MACLAGLSENKVFYDIYTSSVLPDISIRKEGPTAVWNAVVLDGYLTFFIFKGNKLLKIDILIRLI